MGADFMNNKSGSERLKAWVHWKLLEKDLDEDDKQFALDIQDLQKLCEEQRGEIERLKTPSGAFDVLYDDCVKNKASVSGEWNASVNGKNYTLRLYLLPDGVKAEDLIFPEIPTKSQLAEKEKELELLKQDASGKAICIIHDSRMCLDCEAWWKKRFSEIKTDLANLKESFKCGKVRPLNNKVEGR